MMKKVIDNGVRFTQMYYLSYLWILPQEKYLLTKKMSFVNWIGILRTAARER